MASETKKDSILSDFNSVSSITKFVIGAVAGYVLMFPVESFMDAARSTFIHSTTGEPFVAAATDIFNWVMPGVADMYSGVTAPYDEAINGSFSNAASAVVDATPVSPQTVKSASDTVGLGLSMFNN